MFSKIIFIYLTVKIRSHLQEHPTEPAFICRRKISKDGNSKSLDSLSIFEVSRLLNIQIVNFDGDKNHLQNNDHVAKIAD
jgi:hypothetical protein